MRPRWLLRALVAVAAALLSMPICAAAAIHHELAVSLDPRERLLRVADRVRIGAGRALGLRLDGRFRIESVTLDGRTVTPERVVDGNSSGWRLNVAAPPGRDAVLEVRYAGELEPLGALDHRQVLAIVRPLAGPEGAFIGANTAWYPQGDSGPGLVTYRMRVNVPAGYRPIASGRVSAEGHAAGGFTATFEATDPLPGIDLIAGPYTVNERVVALAPGRDVRVRTYFHGELADLASPYLDAVAGYLGRYDALIGPYALPCYSVVSSPLPTGFGMPGIAYLGRQVLRLPFIRATSLGHEVLHDWWGNGVYPDYGRGNWSEGLTTFMADYAFKEDAGEHEAQAMRMAWLRDFAAVRPGDDRPLSAFVSRRHGADQAIGYGKTAFVFFMLRDLLGEKRFRAGLQRFWLEHRFRVAAWDDLRRAFEASGGQELGWFFAQWITRAGAPVIEIVSARRGSDALGHRLMVELRQGEAPYRLSVPLRVHLEDGSALDTRVAVSGARARASVALPARAQSLLLDPDARLFRRAAADELAPILREIMLDRRTALVAASGSARAREAASAVAAAMLEHVPRDWEGPVRDRPPLLIIGLDADVAGVLAREGLPAPPAELAGRGTAFAYARRNAEGTAYAVVAARDAGALAALARALPHLGAQSFVAFDGARPIERGVWPLEARRHPVSD